MFCDCSSLSSLHLSDFINNNIKDMSCMFFNYSSLISLNLYNCNTNNVNNMNGFTKYCLFLFLLY
jgi:hypothetical protein